MVASSDIGPCTTDAVSVPAAPTFTERARALKEDDATYRALASLFGALADPTRARIVHMLLHRELCTHDLATILGVTDSCVSQHLKILRALRLVKSRRAGRFLYHALDDAHIRLLVQVGLTHLRDGEQLDAEEAPL